MTNENKIQYLRRAYNLGVKDAKNNNYTCFYTPRLQMAYNLGYEGIEVDFGKIVKGYRYGQCPEQESWNYLSNTKEDGVSLAALDGGKEVGSSIWFTDREKINVEGVLISSKGSDGEPLIIPLDFNEQFDF